MTADTTVSSTSVKNNQTFIKIYSYCLCRSLCYITLFLRLSAALSVSSLVSALFGNCAAVGSASELESKLNDTELFFFRDGLSVVSEVEICVGAIVIGGTQSFDRTISASLYCNERKNN